MIEAKIDGNVVKCTAQGGVTQLACDVAHLICSLHLSYRRAGEAAGAEAFRAILVMALTAPDSPVWQGDTQAEGVSVVVPSGEEGDDGEGD